jgi:hypothetical protein
MAYAKDTEVSVEKSRAEIESILKRYGASHFAYMTEPTRAVIAFRAKDRNIRFDLPLPLLRGFPPHALAKALARQRGDLSRMGTGVPPEMARAHPLHQGEARERREQDRDVRGRVSRSRRDARRPHSGGACAPADRIRVRERRGAGPTTAAESRQCVSGSEKLLRAGNAAAGKVRGVHARAARPQSDPRDRRSRPRRARDAGSARDPSSSARTPSDHRRECQTRGGSRRPDNRIMRRCQDTQSRFGKPGLMT